MFSAIGPLLYFSGEQFREWIKLYEQDINEFDFSHCSIGYAKPFVIKNWCSEMEDIINSDEDKEVFWG